MVRDRQAAQEQATAAAIELAKQEQEAREQAAIAGVVASQYAQEQKILEKAKAAAIELENQERDAKAKTAAINAAVEAIFSAASTNITEAEEAEKTVERLKQIQGELKPGIDQDQEQIKQEEAANKIKEWVRKRQAVRKKEAEEQAAREQAVREKEAEVQAAIAGVVASQYAQEQELLKQEQEQEQEAIKVAELLQQNLDKETANKIIKYTAQNLVEGTIANASIGDLQKQKGQADKLAKLNQELEIEKDKIKQKKLQEDAATIIYNWVLDRQAAREKEAKLQAAIAGVVASQYAQEQEAATKLNNSAIAGVVASQNTQDLEVLIQEPEQENRVESKTNPEFSESGISGISGSDSEKSDSESVVSGSDGESVVSKKSDSESGVSKKSDSESVVSGSDGESESESDISDISDISESESILSDDKNNEISRFKKRIIEKINPKVDDNNITITHIANETILSNNGKPNNKIILLAKISPPNVNEIYLYNDSKFYDDNSELYNSDLEINLNTPIVIKATNLKKDSKEKKPENIPDSNSEEENIPNNNIIASNAAVAAAIAQQNKPDNNIIASNAAAAAIEQQKILDNNIIASNAAVAAAIAQQNKPGNN